MTQTNDLTKPSIHPIALWKLMSLGAVIALALIIIFLIPTPPNHSYPKYWMVRPLIIVPFAGAMGGLCFYILDFLRIQGGWKKIIANVLSFFICLVGLWLGFVLGLDGTLWD